MTTVVTENPDTDTPPPGRSRGKALYQALWRWHFYAGLLCLPFLVVLAVTGGIYLFKPQVEAALYADLTHVQAQQTQPRPYSEQVASALEGRDGAAVLDVKPPVGPDRSTAVDLTTADTDLTVFVDPYTARVLGERDESTRFMSVIEEIHGSLTLGDFGDRVMELAACTSIVLVLSGVYLYWPRGRRKTTRKPTGRAAWKTWHGRIGLTGSVLVLALLLTGLPWTGVWGELYQQIATSTGLDKPSVDAESDTSVRAGELDALGKPVPWAAEGVPVPTSGHGHGSHSGHGGHGSGHGEAPNAAPVPLETVLSVAEREGVRGPLKVVMPEGPSGVYTVGIDSEQQSAPSAQRTLFLDQYTGEPLSAYGWQDYGVMAKATTIGIRMHEGTLFGPVNVALALLAVLVVLALVVSSVVMWLRRRPRGTIGAPPSPPERAVLRVLAVLMLALGIVLPLFGIALVVVLLLEFLVLRRVGVLRRWFAIS